MSELIEISVAIHNQWEITEKFLVSLFKSIEKYRNVVVNIIDNASTDKTVVELEKFSKKCTIFYNDNNMGFAFAHNMIIRKSFATLSCILHNDIILVDGWLEKLVNKILSDPKIGIVSVVNDIYGNFNKGYEINQEGNYESIEIDNEEKKVDFVNSSCMLIRNNVFKKIGVFDEKFALGFMSDADLCVRAKEVDFKIEVCKDVILEHLNGCTTRIVDINRFREQNRQYFIQKNKDWIEKNKGKVITRKRR